MSEKEIGQKWDRCLADCAIKAGTGLGLGIVFSVVFFKRRTFPIAFGTGLGLGMAYSNCQNDFRSHYVLHSNVAKVCVFDLERPSNLTISLQFMSMWQKYQFALETLGSFVKTHIETPKLVRLLFRTTSISVPNFIIFLQLLFDSHGR